VGKKKNQAGDGQAKQRRPCRAAGKIKGNTATRGGPKEIVGDAAKTPLEGFWFGRGATVGGGSGGGGEKNGPSPDHWPIRKENAHPSFTMTAIVGEKKRPLETSGPTVSPAGSAKKEGRPRPKTSCPREEKEEPFESQRPRENKKVVDRGLSEGTVPKAEKKNRTERQA